MKAIALAAGGRCVRALCWVVPSLRPVVACWIAWRRPSRIVLVEAASPMPREPYAEAMVTMATRDCGFRWLAAGRMPELPSLAVELLGAEDGSALAVVVAGRTNTHTTLYTPFDDGTWLSTTDTYRLAEASEAGARRQTLLNADFAELWRLHAASVADAGRPIAAFAPEAAWDAFQAAIVRPHIDRLVAAGLARLLDDSSYRATFRGAVRATILHAVKRRFAATSGYRHFRRRPGDRVRVAERPEETVPVAERAPDDRQEQR